MIAPMTQHVRPRYVDDALFADEIGLRYGRYHDFVLRTSYQPAFRLHGDMLVPAAVEGLISATRNGVKVPPSRLFAETAQEDGLFVDGMCRALHLHNFEHFDGENLDLWIRLDMTATDNTDHWLREIRVMASKMAEMELPARRVICQIDGCASADAEMTAALASELRKHGMRVAIDDFGDADLTLERVEAIKPDFIRVDGSLFRDLCRVRQAKMLIRPLVGSFRNMGTAVVIEGIETAAQLEIAADSGADFLQGFALAAPQAAGCLFDAGPRPVSGLLADAGRVSQLRA